MLSSLPRATQLFDDRSNMQVSLILGFTEPRLPLSTKRGAHLPGVDQARCQANLPQSRQAEHPARGSPHQEELGFSRGRNEPATWLQGQFPSPGTLRYNMWEGDPQPCPQDNLTRCRMAARIRYTEPTSSGLKPITLMASVTAWWWFLSSLSEAWEIRGSAPLPMPRPTPPSESLL